MTAVSNSLASSILSLSSQWADDSPSDDEIVWSLSSSGFLSSPERVDAPSSPGSEDFVLVPRNDASTSGAALPIPHDQLAEALASLSLSPAPTTFTVNLGPASPSSPSKKKKKPAAAKPKAQPQPVAPKPQTPSAKQKKRAKSPDAARATASYPSPPASPEQSRKAGTPPPRPNSRERRRTARATAAKAPAAGEKGLGERTVVDDVSEVGDAESPAYQEAQKYMTSYLERPPAEGNNGSSLLVLQALILELGIQFRAGSTGSQKPASSYFSIPDLPRSLRQAKMLLKSQAFINVRDYLAVRGQGQAALQSVMHPSRSSLVKEVRKGKRMPVKEVKKAGLNVLLVQTRA